MIPQQTNWVAFRLQKQSMFACYMQHMHGYGNIENHYETIAV